MLLLGRPGQEIPGPAAKTSNLMFSLGWTSQIFSTNFKWKNNLLPQNSRPVTLNRHFDIPCHLLIEYYIVAFLWRKKKGVKCKIHQFTALGDLLRSTALGFMKAIVKIMYYDVILTSETCGSPFQVSERMLHMTLCIYCSNYNGWEEVSSPMKSEFHSPLSMLP